MNMHKLKEYIILMSATISIVRIREQIHSNCILSALKDMCRVHNTEGKKLNGIGLAGLIFYFSEPLPDCKISIHKKNFIDPEENSGLNNGLIRKGFTVYMILI